MKRRTLILRESDSMSTLGKALSLIISLCVITSIVGCSNRSDNQDTVQNTDINITDFDGTQSIGEVQTVNKGNLGISMELSGVYSDCKIADLTKDELLALVGEAVGGFRIIKTISNIDYTVVNIVVASRELADNDVIKSGFQYVYSGNKYMILASKVDITDEHADKELINALNNEVLRQFETIFFVEDNIKDINGGVAE